MAAIALGARGPEQGRSGLPEAASDQRRYHRSAAEGGAGSSELPVDEPGTFQIDLVGHDGGNPNGHFAFTLDAVELFSGWVEPRILLNKCKKLLSPPLEGAAFGQ